MNKYILSTTLLCVLYFSIFAQTTDLQITIIDGEHNEALIGASVLLEDLDKGTTTDLNGTATFTDIPFGEYHVHVSYVGYEELEVEIDVNATNNTFTFKMEEAHEALGEVVVEATRSTRTIQNIPTRVEFIGLEELGEKAIMNSANISIVLRESTGIQIQQSSLSSGNSSIRIQGLDGRYTQLLKDGFPLYGGFSGGLSIMQIPPLDLQQFEIIKGSSSTLYGGGAIAGLVNMVSKTPDEDGDPALDIMLTQTQALGSTANVFYGQRKGKIGYTLYGSGHYQLAYDPDGDDFSNLPETTAFSLNPKLFYYPSEHSDLWVGINATYDDRTGGDITKIREGETGEHQYTEVNKSARINSQAVYNQEIRDNKNLQIKNSISFFDRNLTIPNYTFAGNQINTFTEASFSLNTDKSDWILGANIYSNKFSEDTEWTPRDQSDVTFGVFANNITDFSEKWILESGFRTDYSPNWGVFALPRVSLLWKANDHFSTRLGGGLGYKIPDMFTEEAAKVNYRYIGPIDADNLEAERSYGANLDFNYRGAITEELTFSVNQLFYLTSINNALTLGYGGNDSNFLFEFYNEDGNVLSRGAETNIKFKFHDFRWFINYAYINVTLNYLPDNPQKSYTPKHNAGTVLMYENDKWRIGYEAYYTGKQQIVNSQKTEDFVIMGLLIQKHFDWGSPFINFENFTDRRQSRFTSEVLPPHESPVFKDLYAPTDGFIFSAGVVIRPFGNEHHGH